MSFFTELQRRNVVRVGAAYAIVAWVVAQVAEFAFENFGAPDWVIKSLIVLLLLGLPFVLIFAWVFEMTPEGLKLEQKVEPDTSITQQTGRKIDRVIIVTLVIALIWFAGDRFLSNDAPSAEIPKEPVAENTADEAPADNEFGPDNSVAVLPFIAMSNGENDEYFADGLTEEILNSLAQLPELLVTARTSAFAFKGKDVPPIPEIARSLGVKHVVEGSVRRSGDRLRVTAQLIRANDGFHLWSKNYDSTSADTISVQENIAERIAVALDVVLDDEKSAAMQKAGLRDVEAFTAYQKGLELFSRAHGGMNIITGLREANSYFDEVIERVPSYSRVYPERSDMFIHVLNEDVYAPPGDRLTPEEIKNTHDLAISDYEAAVRYSTSPEQRLLYEADLAFLSGNWRGLTGRAKQALEVNTCIEGNWLPTIANVLGLSAQHRDQAERIIACDPLATLSWFNYARATLWSGDKVEALKIAREGIEIAPGGWLNWFLVRALIENELYEEAEIAIETRIRDELFALGARGLMAAKRGDREQLDRLIGRIEGELDHHFFGPMFAAWGGDRDVANRIAAQYDKHPFGSLILWQISHWCACDANFDLEAAPNFASMIRENNIPWPPVSGREYPLKDW